jgi:Tfx family DNA-binding protein
LDKRSVRAKWLLTERQLQVLELRRKGLSHEEIARMLNTTRENVVILEKRAIKNIRIALETLEYAAAIGGLRIKAARGSRILDLAATIVREADKAGVKLAMSMPELVVELSNKMRGRIEKGRLKEDVEVLVLPDGSLAVVPGLFSP